MTYAELSVKITELLSTLEDMSLCFLMQNFNRGERMFERWSREYGVILAELINHRVEINAGALAQTGIEAVNETVITTELKGLLDAMEQKDYVLMADILKLQIKPFLEGLIIPVGSLAREELTAKLGKLQESGSDEVSSSEDISDKIAADVAAGIAADIAVVENSVLKITGYEYENDGVIYRVEPTSSGLLTLSVTDSEGTYYMHSNDNPYGAAKLMIKQYYDVNSDSFIVYGLGLGYHVLALLEESHGLVPVTVFESDEAVIELARRTVDFSRYEGNGLTIVYDPDLVKFSEAASSGTLIIHYPSLRNIRNSVLRERMNQLFVQDSSVRNQIGEMLANFRYNTAHISKSVDEIASAIEGKDVILVAAGPSLDTNIEYLKGLVSGFVEADRNEGGEADGGPCEAGGGDFAKGEMGERLVVICVGTAFRKLMNAGIAPDYVAFLDASERIRAQIRGFEGAGVPALIASTATMSITRDYKGEKYLVCQQGMDEAEKYASENEYGIYESGGSVATVIMDIAVRLKAARVITIGLDLAYTNSKYHADGAGRSSHIENLDGLVEVCSQTGEKLYTTQAMNMYREWFEGYVARHGNSGVDFIDATEGGALIKGMKVMKLNEVL